MRFKPLHPNGHLPYILLRKTQRRSLNISPLPFAVNTERAFKRKDRRELSSLLPCVAKQYRGGVKPEGLNTPEGLEKITASVSGRENRLYRAGRTPAGRGTRARTV